MEDADDPDNFWPKPNGWKDRSAEPNFDKATAVTFRQGERSFANEKYSEKQVQAYLQRNVHDRFKMERESKGEDGQLNLEVNDMVVFTMFDSLEEAQADCDKNSVTWRIAKVVRKPQPGDDEVKVQMYGCRVPGTGQPYQDKFHPVRAFLKKGSGRVAWTEYITRKSIFLVNGLEFNLSGSISRDTWTKINRHPSS